jgi:TatD DNase family protein
MYPTLDTHAHLDPSRSPDELSSSGAVLSMCLSLEKSERALERCDPQITWGIGCHPRFPASQADFDFKRFCALAMHTAVIGEVGLDTGSRVPMEMQVKIFREVLEFVAGTPRLVSIHSFRAAAQVLKELERTPITVPILHWWTGNVAETRRAVAIGCYFSIHSAVARHSKFRLHVPLERILVESDHGFYDPPAAIPCRIEWAGHLVAQQYGMDVMEIRRLCWSNLGRIVHLTRTSNLFPEQLAALFSHFEQSTHPA